MKSVTAFISFLCLVVIFKSCYSLKCHECDSEIANPEKNCINIVDDRYLIDCPSNSRCSEIYVTYYDGETNIIRNCLTNDLLTNINPGLRELNTVQAAVHGIVCNTNGCNRKFTLPFPSHSPDYQSL